MTSKPTQERFELNGRVALVTGALGLLGREHCQALLEAGCTVIVSDLNDDACGNLARQLSQDTGGQAVGIAADISDKQSVEAVRGQLRERFGRLDILVNNAALNDAFEDPQASAELSKFENYPLELFRKSLEVNVTGTFICCQVLGQMMLEQGDGSIINVASTYGVVAPDQSIYRKPDGSQPFYKSAAYPTTKAAVLGLTRFLAAYWGRAGVRVNALSPGGVQNGQDEYFIKQYASRTPLGRMASPDDYRGALLFLASEASRYMTGANLVVDGGWTIW
ncbi:MAG: SDR family oxidoreductase [Deltaproteobacteria bacterium]|nr:SDR family oxidoreductase [Deltaproteobacteria bacterium]